MECGGQGPSPNSSIGSGPNSNGPSMEIPALVLEMCMDLPRLLPMVDNLIQPVHLLSMPDLLPQLAAWSISEIQRAAAFGGSFRTHALIMEREILQNIRVSSRNGLAGVDPVSCPIGDVVNFLAEMFLRAINIGHSMPISRWCMTRLTDMM